MLTGFQYAYTRVPAHLLVVVAMLLSGLHCTPAAAEYHSLENSSVVEDRSFPPSPRDDRSPSHHEGTCRTCQIIGSPIVLAPVTFTATPSIGKLRPPDVPTLPPTGRSLLRLCARAPPNL